MIVAYTQHEGRSRSYMYEALSTAGLLLDKRTHNGKIIGKLAESISVIPMAPSALFCQTSVGGHDNSNRI